MSGAAKQCTLFALSIVAALAAAGCAPEAMQPGNLSLVQTTSDMPRAGNVYLLRGFIGIWSTGINDLTDKINQSGVRANVYRCEQWEELTQTILEKYRGQTTFEPLILVGHSWGGDHAIDLARTLQSENIPVDLIVTLDPCTYATIPENVKRVQNIYQPNGTWDKIPFFRGVPLKTAPGSKVDLANLNIRENRTDLLDADTDHYNIEKKEKIHSEIIAQILTVCPPRDAWVRSHPSGSPRGSVAGEARTAGYGVAGSKAAGPPNGSKAVTGSGAPAQQRREGPGVSRAVKGSAAGQ